MGSNKTTEIEQTNRNTKRLTKYLHGVNRKDEKWLKKSEKERDELERQVVEQASFNYAREPDCVRDRNKLRHTLDELANLKKHMQSRYSNKILQQLEKTQEKIVTEARSAEEKSERMAKDFLDGNIKHEDFLERYINIRKNAILRRLSADNLVKERGKLEGANVVATASCKTKNTTTSDQQNSPTPTPRQRKRLSLNINK